MNRLLHALKHDECPNRADLSAVGGGARNHDRNTGQLVSAVILAQADDGPFGLRRRRQSRSDPNPRQKRGEAKAQNPGAKAEVFKTLRT
jgi:hypothetical protein